MKYPFISAAEAASSIRHGDTVGIGGFSSVGTPKAVPAALAEHAGAMHREGKEFKVGLITGGMHRKPGGQRAGSCRCSFVPHPLPVEQRHAQLDQRRRSAVLRPSSFADRPRRALRLSGESQRGHRRSLRHHRRRRNHSQHLSGHHAYPAPGGRQDHHRS